MHVRTLLSVVAAVAALGACEQSKNRKLDLDLVRVTSDAKLRTDTVGGDRFTEHATFVLVDAENAGGEGAIVSLGGTLAVLHNRGGGTTVVVQVPIGEPALSPPGL